MAEEESIDFFLDLFLIFVHLCRGVPRHFRSCTYQIYSYTTSVLTEET